MSDTPANGNGGRDRLRAAADSTFAIIFARLMMPAALAVIGTLMIMVLRGVESSVNEVKQAGEKTTASLWSQIDKVNAATASTHEALEVLISKFDSLQTSNRAAFDALNGRLGDHEARIRGLESRPVEGRR